MSRKAMYSAKGQNREMVFPVKQYSQELYDTGEKYIDLVAARAMRGIDHFWCVYDLTIYPKGWCGRECDGYSPRNGKSGICTHNGPVYEDTDKEYRLYSDGKFERIK